MKKLSITALITVSVILFTFAFGTGVSAVDTADAVLSESQAQSAAAGVVREFTGADSSADIIFHDDLTKAMDGNSDGTITAGEAAEVFSSFVYAAADDMPAAQRIAEESQYRVTVLSNGTKTVYVFVDIKNNPELLDFNVFADSVHFIEEKQKQVAAAQGGDFSLLTYEQLAGELALHAIVYSITDAFGGEQEGNIFHDYYESAQNAQLNIDESRVPAWFISFLGQLIRMFRNLFTIN